MDVPIDRPANNHYVHVGRPGATFHVDIGVRSRDGRFARIASSSAVETPRDSIAADTRVEWMTVTFDVIDRVPKLRTIAAYTKQSIRDKLIEHRQYIETHGEDLPEIRDWA